MHGTMPKRSTMAFRWLIVGLLILPNMLAATSTTAERASPSSTSIYPTKSNRQSATQKLTEARFQDVADSYGNGMLRSKRAVKNTPAVLPSDGGINIPVLEKAKDIISEEDKKLIRRGVIMIYGERGHV